MRVPEQVTRIAVVLAVLIGAVVLLRFVILPPTVFSTRLHEESTVERVTAAPIRFAGSLACVECHEDEYEVKNKGYHRGLACEGCHGASWVHTEEPDDETPTAPRERKHCPVCHAYDPARPTGFPQIEPKEHNPRKDCISCHQPHDPVPPEVPKECSACHGQISRTKAVSSHALLDCTTCHEVTSQHRITPRRARPSTPDTRDFCATCHETDAGNPDSPKIDMAEHYGNYLCWQCHYPHLPEGRQ